jgi:hypothetical protein
MPDAAVMNLAVTIAATIASAAGAYAAVRAEIRHLWADIRRHDADIAELRAQLLNNRG